MQPYASSLIEVTKDFLLYHRNSSFDNAAEKVELMANKLIVALDSIKIHMLRVSYLNNDGEKKGGSLRRF